MPNEELSVIRGVESIEKRGSGRSIKISEAEVGREIFRMEAAENNQENLSARSEEIK